MLQLHDCCFCHWSQVVHIVFITESKKTYFHSFHNPVEIVRDYKPIFFFVFKLQKSGPSRGSFSTLTLYSLFDLHSGMRETFTSKSLE